MMQGVFFDLKYFIAFNIFVLLLFSVLFSVLAVNLSDTYTGTSNIGYFLMAFRTSLGDFDVEEFSSLSESVLVVAWIIWLLAVVIMNIIFMNFLIAVISESYEKIMQKLVSQTFQGKV